MVFYKQNQFFVQTIDYEILLIIQMEEIKQQPEQFNSEISFVVDSILMGDILAPIRIKTLQKLVNLCKRESQVKHVISLIKKQLKCCQLAPQRLKILLITCQVLFSVDQANFFSQFNSILNNYEKTLSLGLDPVVSLQKIQDYLKANVELPFVQFLRKTLRWREEDQSTDETHYTDKGFSQLNKIKSAFQLRIIFHNYACYYRSHLYAGGMFRLVVKTICKWWNDVCEVANEIISQAKATRIILQEDYLLLKEADNTQDLLVDFIYTGNFKKNIQKNLKIRRINFIPDEVHQIYLELNKNRSKSLPYHFAKNTKDEDEQNTKTRNSDSFEEGYTALDKIQMLQSIINLESLLKQA